MQHVYAINNLRSANFSNFLDNATMAICILSKPVGSTQTLHSTWEAASNSIAKIMCEFTRLPGEQVTNYLQMSQTKQI